MRGKRRYRRTKKSGNYLIWLIVLLILYIYSKFDLQRYDKDTVITVIIAIIILVTIAAIGLGILIKYLKRQKYLKSPLGAVDNMSGEEFERYLKAHFENLGYRVKLTPVSHDYGADLICKKNNETIAVQAKRYKGKVGNSAIQEIVAAKAYYKADRCMVVTNSFFTGPAVVLAESNNVELWDRKSLNRFFKVN